MKLTKIIDKFYQQGVDDIEIKKENNQIIIGYFNEYPVNLIVITDGYITSITPSKWDKTKWIYQLLEDKIIIEDDYS